MNIKHIFNPYYAPIYQYFFFIFKQINAYYKAIHNVFLAFYDVSKYTKHFMVCLKSSFPTF